MELRLTVKLNGDLTGLTSGSALIVATRALAAAGLEPSGAKVVPEEQYQADLDLFATLVMEWTAHGEPLPGTPAQDDEEDS